MPLDPEVAAMLARLPPHVDARLGTAAQHRLEFEQILRLQRTQGSSESVGSSVGVDVDGVPCWLHLPDSSDTAPSHDCSGPNSDPLHVLVYLHGGGWIVGGIDEEEVVTRSLCARTGIAVLAVDYRLAPENPFPAPLEDCLTAARWAAEQGFASVSVGGDSSGGNLAAAVALVFRAEGRPLACQLLVYPALDAGAATPSYDRNARGFGLEADDMRWFWDQYGGAHQKDDPLFSPWAAGDLAGLAPAIVVTAEYDVLRDEGVRYAERLGQAGVKVWHKSYAGLTHGFFGQGGMVAAADLAFTEIAHAVRDLVTL